MTRPEIALNATAENNFIKKTTHKKFSPRTLHTFAFALPTHNKANPKGKVKRVQSPTL